MKDELFSKPPTSPHKPLVTHNDENSNIANPSELLPIDDAPDCNEYIKDWDQLPQYLNTKENH